MTDYPQSTGEDAQATIARQAAEIERLKRDLARESFARELGDALIASATTGILASPVTQNRLLEMIVEAAARVINAKAASLLLVDPTSQMLKFEVAIGGKAQEVKQEEVPLGHGIAGLVAVSGYPMAVTHAQDDPASAADIAERVGYHPTTVLCVPLFYHDAIIGVLELLDKQGAPAFTKSDIDALALFANQAAVAIEQSRANQNVVTLVGEVCKSLRGNPDTTPRGLQARMQEFASYLDGDPKYRQALDLAFLVHEIAWQGEAESQACRTLLSGFADYLRAQPRKEW